MSYILFLKILMTSNIQDRLMAVRVQTFFCTIFFSPVTVYHGETLFKANPNDSLMGKIQKQTRIHIKNNKNVPKQRFFCEFNYCLWVTR